MCEQTGQMLELAEQSVQSPAFSGNREYWLKRIAEHRERVRVWEERDPDAFDDDERETWNAVVTGLGYIRTSGPRPECEWRGMDTLNSQYASGARTTVESLSRRADLLAMAATNLAVRQGSRRAGGDGRDSFGLEQKARIADTFGESRPRTSAEVIDMARMLKAELEDLLFLSDVPEERIQLMHGEIDEAWKDITPDEPMM